MKPSPLHPAARPGSARWPYVTALALGAAFAWGLSRRGAASLLDSSAEERPVSPRSDLTPAEKINIEIFKRVSPSVAYIATSALRRDYFSRNVFEIPEGTGSGFVWDENGYIVTNYHVVANVSQGRGKARVLLADESKPFDATVIAVAEDKDLAVLKVNAPKKLLHPIPVGTSRDLEVGQVVYAIGNPFGFDHTLTTGIISALDREIRAPSPALNVPGRLIQGVIQTDAAINPGNSGGPLLDSSGRLIGVNAQIFSPAGTSAGIGFAIPVDTVNRIVPQIIRSGRAVRIGIGIHLIPDWWTHNAGLKGVLFQDVTRGGGAERAGLRPTKVSDDGTVEEIGDLIVAVDGTEVESLDDLSKIIDRHEAGDRVVVTVERDGKRKDVPVTLRPLE
ncbi:MAG TPA: trypsin-like peptidase domain-containing protein [Planctomycetota bacterium]|jgi:S1-C subfamily serine protease|nr:trypsin-like peptidase domain-containing protein [Planctomycetota bacterium]